MAETGEPGTAVDTAFALCRDLYTRMEREMRESLYGMTERANRVGTTADQVCYRATVNQKSLELLRSWLSPAQLTQYDREGQFIVVGSHSKKRYLITSGAQPYNVIELGKNGWFKSQAAIKQRYCFVPSNGARAAGDVMLAQKIALETDEQAALKVANTPMGYAPPLAGLTWTNNDALLEIEHVDPSGHP